MHALDDALDREIHELDTVLLRLTTLRLLMAAGKHQMVDQAIEELEDSMSSFVEAERQAVTTLSEHGFANLSDLSAALEPAARSSLERRGGALRSLHREVRVALATTGAAAERSLRNATAQLQGGPAMVPASKRNPFLTGE